MAFNTFTIYGFTNEANIEALYSTNGYNNILDDLSAGDKTKIMSQIIYDAEQTIIVRLNRFYAPAELANSEWVKSRATWIAAHLLSKRRGNEYYFADLYEDALREVDAIATGELPPLPDIAQRDYTYPSMSNLIVDEYFISAKLRVRPHISVGDTYPNQDIAYSWIWGWM
jgi:hypothetical protein